MSVHSDALASLIVNYYTDSEGEDGVDDDLQENSNTAKGAASQNVGQIINSSYSDRSASNGGKNINISNAPTLVTEVTPKVLRLVSYFDDTVDPDDDGAVVVATEDDEPDAYGVVIPSNPPGTCPAEIQQKITDLYRKVESGRLDIKKFIQQRKDFRNPCMYEKLIEYCGINELGTNYPPDRYDAFNWTDYRFLS